jgi:hypothetical protein
MKFDFSRLVFEFGLFTFGIFRDVKSIFVDIDIDISRVTEEKATDTTCINFYNIFLVIFKTKILKH